MIDFTNIFQLIGLKSKNKDHANFYECCDLTKKSKSNESTHLICHEISFLKNIEQILPISNKNVDPLNDALNGVQAYMEGGQPIYDQNYYAVLVECLNNLDSRLLKSVGSQWEGMLTFANAGGNSENGDIWHTCKTNEKWFEDNCTVQEYGNVPIFEPCNYASNIAYYHTATEICARENWLLSEDKGIFSEMLKN